MAEPPPPDKSLQHHPLLVLLVAVCVGILLDRYWNLGASGWIVVGGAGAVAWGWLWRAERTWMAGATLLLTVASIAGLWHHLRWQRGDPEDLVRYAQLQPASICVEGIVSEGPRRIPAGPFDPMQLIAEVDRSTFDLRVTALRDGSTWRPVDGGATASVKGHLLGVHPGDRVRVFGALAPQRRVENPGQSDTASAARSREIQSWIFVSYPDCVTVVGEQRGPEHWLARMREAGDRVLAKHLDRDRAPLASAILLGVREGIDRERIETFRVTGTSHLLAISGLHVGILALAMLWIARLVWLPRSWGLLAAAIAAVVYTLLTDSRPPAVRATILVLAFCASGWTQRPPMRFNSLAASGLLVLGLNPTEIFSTGAQLSFLAVAGVMTAVPTWFADATPTDPLDQLEAKLRRDSESGGWKFAKKLGRLFRDMMLAGTAIWCMVAPLVAARFHVLAPVGILLTAFVWIPMGMAVISGFCVLLLARFLPGEAGVAAFCCDNALAVIEWIITQAERIPAGHFWVPGPANWWLVGCYGGLALLAVAGRYRPPRRWCFALAATWIGVGLTVASIPPADQLQCTVLSVDHGSAVLMRFPSGRTVLLDAGQFSSPRRGAQTISEALWRHGSIHIDAVILSHDDADHYNCLPRVLERFSVGVIYVSDVFWEDSNPAMDALAESILASGTPMRTIHGGQFLDVGTDATLEVLHPPRRGILGDDNANSVVVAIESFGRRILLPGDLSPPGLDDVLAEQPFDCDILVSPHHGSARSNPPGMLQWCTPEWVLTSGGHNDVRQDVLSAYRRQGAQVLHTSQRGAIQVTITPDRMSVQATHP